MIRRCTIPVLLLFLLIATIMTVITGAKTSTQTTDVARITKAPSSLSYITPLADDPLTIDTGADSQTIGIPLIALTAPDQVARVIVMYTIDQRGTVFAHIPIAAIEKTIMTSAYYDTGGPTEATARDCVTTRAIYFPDSQDSAIRPTPAARGWITSPANQVSPLHRSIQRM